jgi:endogenous inhibitor of DNA gyrase (YacG/DUF329 family)
MAMNKIEQVKMSASGRVICPRCGTETNRHAEKIDYSADPAGPMFDAALGGSLMEFHTCPGCKHIVERNART